MIFHIFNSQEERRSFGGSAFIEMQFCKMPFGSKTKKLVAVNSITHWQNDSLYIKEQDIFYQEYSQIFDCGTYHNLKTGIVDTFGINYYAPYLIDSIIEKLQTAKPTDYGTLIEWLEKAKEYNGFYILGI